MLAKMIANNRLFLVEIRTVEEKEVQNRPHLGPSRRSWAVSSGKFERLVFHCHQFDYVQNMKGIPGLQTHILVSYVQA